MEETRISRIYWTLLLRWLGAAPGRIVNGQWLRSGVTWIVLCGAALIGVAVMVHEQGRGDLHRMKTNLGARPAYAPSPIVRPGGEAPLILSRNQAEGAFTPEFLSTTLLPGRGLNVLQIMAFLPGKGPVPLLASPSLDDAAAAMTGMDGDQNGRASLTMGAAFELPWAGRISGAPLPGNLSIGATWMGRQMILPTVGGAGADGGLFLQLAPSSVQPSILPDGGVCLATYEAGDWNGRWLSTTQVQIAVILTGHHIDLTVQARNTGTEPEPMGIGWRPHFALAPGDRAHILLRLPSSGRADTRTGRLLPTAGTPNDFASPDGTPLPATSLDDVYAPLRSSAVAAGPETEWRNVSAGYGLRLTALSGSMHAIHITAPAGAPYLMVEPQTNYDDPLGRQWPPSSSGALTVLKAGESLEWKVRLEIFPLAARANSGTPAFTPQRIQP